MQAIRPFLRLSVRARCLSGENEEGEDDQRQQMSQEKKRCFVILMTRMHQAEVQSEPGRREPPDDGFTDTEDKEGLSTVCLQIRRSHWKLKADVHLPLCSPAAPNGIISRV